MSFETENTGVPEVVEAIVSAGTEPKKSRKRTAAEKEKEARYYQDAKARRHLEERQKEVREGIRSTLEHYDNPVEETKPSAKRLLEARGIASANIDNIYDLGLKAAVSHRLPTNAFYWANGLTATLESIASGSAVLLEPINPADIPGELVDPTTLYALWDFSEAAQSESLTFEQFKELRYRVKDDFFTLSKIEDKDFCEQPHRKFVDLMPKLDCKKLKRDYTQRDMQNFLAASNDGFKQRLLISSRNSLKSSFVILWCLQALLILPDLRLLLLTETHPLSTLFLRSLRNYLVVKGSPSQLQRLFPEACLEPGDGNSTEFRMPNARLGLVQGVQASSFRSSGFAGSRFDFAVADDPSSEESISPDAIKNTIDKYDAISKLAEIKSLGTLVVMTPWSQTPPDLGAELLRRNEEDDDKFLLYHVEPCFEIKPEAAVKFAANDLLSLEESDVTLTYPTRLTWAWIREEMKKSRSNEFRFFRSQNLCQWLPPQDAELRVTFTEAELKARTKPRSYFEPRQVIETVFSLDTAWSVSKFCDYSCGIVTEICKHNGKTIALVTAAFLDRLKIPELAIAVVEAIRTHNPTKVVAEKSGAWQSLWLEIQKVAMQRGCMLPHFYWRATNLGGTTMKTKVARIKGLEPRISDSSLWFCEGIPCLEQGLLQMVNFDGISKSSKKHNDFPDALALGIETFFPNAGSEQSEELKKAEDDAQNARTVQAMHNYIFGSDPIRRAPETDDKPRRHPWDVFNPSNGGGNTGAPASQHFGWGSLHRAKQ